MLSYFSSTSSAGPTVTGSCTAGWLGGVGGPAVRTTFGAEEGAEAGVGEPASAGAARPPTDVDEGASAPFFVLAVGASRRC